MMDELKPCPLDEARKVLWYCAQFTDNTHWKNQYRRALTAICDELDCRPAPENNPLEMSPKHKAALAELVEMMNEGENKPLDAVELAKVAMALQQLKSENAELVEMLNKDKNNPLTVTFPCEIGDIIYEVEEGLPITSYYVNGFIIGKTEFEDEEDEAISERHGWQIEYGKPGIDCECPLSEFGMSLFLTREAASMHLPLAIRKGAEKHERIYGCRTRRNAGGR